MRGQFLRSVLLALCLSLLMPIGVLAQSSGEDTLFGGAICGFFLVMIVINILILVWVIKDADARGTSAGAWVVVVFLFGVFGLLAYMIARPNGKLVPCPQCGKKKPITDAICPHCGQRVV